MLLEYYYTDAAVDTGGSTYMCASRLYTAYSNTRVSNPKARLGYTTAVTHVKGQS